MKRLITILFLLLSVFCFGQNQRQLNKFLNSLEQDSLLCNSSWALQVCELENGRVLLERNAMAPLVPASTTKAITCGVGLLVLGEDFKWQTKLAISGKIEDKTLYGSLFIIGEGDPTLALTQQKRDSLFKNFANKLNEISVKKIVGEIVADDSYFINEGPDNSWLWEDIGAYYGTKQNALCYYDNKITYQISSLNGKAEVLSLYPEIPDFSYINKITVADETEIYTYSNPFYNNPQVLKGIVAPNKSSVKIEAANYRAPETFLYNFAEYLNVNGFDVSQAKQRVTNEKESYDVIYTNYSEPYKNIAKLALKQSNNFTTEQILRTIGKFTKGDKRKEAIEYEKLFFTDSLNLSNQGYRITDGSGLSRQDNISPHFFCNFFVAINKRPQGKAFIEFLSSPKGFEGTVWAKSGGMSGVRSYGGYAKGKSGKLYAFSFIINGYLSPRLEADKRMDMLFKELSNL